MKLNNNESNCEKKLTFWHPSFLPKYFVSTPEEREKEAFGSNFGVTATEKHNLLLQGTETKKKKRETMIMTNQEVNQLLSMLEECPQTVIHCWIYGHKRMLLWIRLYPVSKVWNRHENYRMMNQSRTLGNQSLIQHWNDRMGFHHHQSQEEEGMIFPFQAWPFHHQILVPMIEQLQGHEDWLDLLHSVLMLHPFQRIEVPQAK